MIINNHKALVLSPLRFCLLLNAVVKLMCRVLSFSLSLSLLPKTRTTHAAALLTPRKVRYETVFSFVVDIFVLIIQHSAMASISIKPPFGKDATPTVDLAGPGVSKNSL